MGKPQRVSLKSDPKPPKPTGKDKPKRRLWLRILLWITVTLVSLGLVGAGVVAYAYSTVKMPDPNADFRTNTSFVYYGDAKKRIGSYQVQNRISIPYAEMPQYVKDGIVAAENRSFWTDPGISVNGLFRAALGLVGIQGADNTATGGGSTITQQYIKIMYLTQERSFSRKATEILLAAKMGNESNKEQILWGYLNTVYFGRGAYGIEAASRTFFKKPASKLTLAEAVALCSIVNSPGNLDPASGQKQAADLLERYQYTLNGMVELGNITAAEKDAVYSALPTFQPVDEKSRLGGQTGFLLKLVEDELKAKGFTDDQITGGGLKVITTFDAKAQQAAVETAQKMTLQAAHGSKKDAKQLHAAIASVDNGTGGVIAMYGNPDYVKNSRNWATTPRQTGSTFKPYALTAALREGWTLKDQVSSQTKTQGKDGRLAWAGGKKVSLLSATTNSINDAYFNLVSELKNGPEAVVQAANDAGAPTGQGWFLDAYLPLGTPMVSPIDQASSYSTFANYGVHRPWHVVQEVFNASGQSLYKADTAGDQTIEKDVAQDVTYALSKVAQNGTGHAAGTLGWPAAGKTGTKGQPGKHGRETISAWFVGFTAQISTAVMYVKGDDGQQDLGYGWFGSTYPAQTWVSYMRKVMVGKERVSFMGATNRKSTQTPTPSPSQSSTPKPPPSPAQPPSLSPTPQDPTPGTESPTPSPKGGP